MSTVLLAVPPDVQAKVLAGTWTLCGGVVRDNAGRIVKFLEAAKEPAKEASKAATKAGPAAVVVFVVVGVGLSAWWWSRRHVRRLQRRLKDVDSAIRGVLEENEKGGVSVESLRALSTTVSSFLEYAQKPGARKVKIQLTYDQVMLLTALTECLMAAAGRRGKFAPETIEEDASGEIARPRLRLLGDGVDAAVSAMEERVAG